MADYKTTVNELREELKRVSSQRYSSEDLKDELETVTKRSKEFQAQVTSLNEVIESLKTENSQIRHELSTTMKAAGQDDLATQQRSKLLQAEGRIEQLTEELASARARIDELKTAARSAEKENQKLSDKLYEFDSALSTGNN